MKIKITTPINWAALTEFTHRDDPHEINPQRHFDAAFYAYEPERWAFFAGTARAYIGLHSKLFYRGDRPKFRHGLPKEYLESLAGLKGGKVVATKDTFVVHVGDRTFMLPKHGRSVRGDLPEAERLAQRVNRSVGFMEMKRLREIVLALASAGCAAAGIDRDLRIATVGGHSLVILPREQAPDVATPAIWDCTIPMDTFGHTPKIDYIVSGKALAHILLCLPQCEEVMLTALPPIVALPVPYPSLTIKAENRAEGTYGFGTVIARTP